MIVFISALSWYTGYVIGQFKLRHPEIHSMGDAGELLMGRFGREFLGIGQLLLLIFLMASNIVTFNILMNVLTDHGTCTLVFGVVGLIICFLGALPRTMEKVYWMSVACRCSLPLAWELAHWLLLSIPEYLCCCDYCHDCHGGGKQRPCPNPSYDGRELSRGFLGRDKHHLCLPYVVSTPGCCRNVQLTRGSRPCCILWLHVRD